MPALELEIERKLHSVRKTWPTAVCRIRNWLLIVGGLFEPVIWPHRGQLQFLNNQFSFEKPSGWIDDTGYEHQTVFTSGT